jgi:hypothetical protein
MSTYASVFHVARSAVQLQQQRRHGVPITRSLRCQAPAGTMLLAPAREAEPSSERERERCQQA